MPPRHAPPPPDDVVPRAAIGGTFALAPVLTLASALALSLVSVSVSMSMLSVSTSMSMPVPMSASMPPSKAVPQPISQPISSSLQAPAVLPAALAVSLAPAAARPSPQRHLAAASVLLDAGDHAGGPAEDHAGGPAGDHARDRAGDPAGDHVGSTVGPRGAPLLGEPEEPCARGGASTERGCPGAEETARRGTWAAGLTSGVLVLVAAGFWVLRRVREDRLLAAERRGSSPRRDAGAGAREHARPDVSR